MGRIVIGKDTVEGDGTIESVMIAAGRHPDAYLYLREGVPIPMDTVLDGEIKAVRVASGG